MGVQHVRYLFGGMHSTGQIVLTVTGQRYMTCIGISWLRGIYQRTPDSDGMPHIYALPDALTLLWLWYMSLALALSCNTRKMSAAATRNHH